MKPISSPSAHRILAPRFGKQAPPAKSARPTLLTKITASSRPAALLSTSLLSWIFMWNTVPPKLPAPPAEPQKETFRLPNPGEEAKRMIANIVMRPPSQEVQEAFQVLIDMAEADALGGTDLRPGPEDTEAAKDALESGFLGMATRRVFAQKFEISLKEKSVPLDSEAEPDTTPRNPDKINKDSLAEYGKASRTVRRYEEDLALQSGYWVNFQNAQGQFVLPNYYQLQALQRGMIPKGGILVKATPEELTAITTARAEEKTGEMSAEATEETSSNVPG